MTDNPLGALIQLRLLIFVICFILAAMYAVINHKMISNLIQDNSNLIKENKELRETLAKYQQPQQPEWVQWLFSDDAPSDPRMSALN